MACGVCDSNRSCSAAAATCTAEPLASLAAAARGARAPLMLRLPLAPPTRQSSDGTVSAGPDARGQTMIGRRSQRGTRQSSDGTVIAGGRRTKWRVFDIRVAYLRRPCRRPRQREGWRGQIARAVARTHTRLAQRFEATGRSPSDLAARRAAKAAVTSRSRRSVERTLPPLRHRARGRPCKPDEAQTLGAIPQ